MQNHFCNHLVALPVIIHFHLFGRGSDVRLAIRSTDRCSSLPRPYPGRFVCQGFTDPPDGGARATRIPALVEPFLTQSGRLVRDNSHPGLGSEIESEISYSNLCFSLSLPTYGEILFQRLVEQPELDAATDLAADHLGAFHGLTITHPSVSTWNQPQSNHIF